MKRLVIVLAALATGCATPQPALQPEVRTVEVKVATPVPCPTLEALGPEPTYVDTDAAIAGASSIGQLAGLYAKGRAQRVQRLAEYAVAKAACLF